MTTIPNKNIVHKKQTPAPVDRSCAESNKATAGSKLSSNTGARTPIEKAEVGIGHMFGLVDYISCTFPSQLHKDLWDLQKMLGGDWKRIGRGSRGYKEGLSSGSVKLWYDGRPSMGINLEATGDGCRELEARGVVEWQTFLAALLAKGAKFCRVDVALDDYAGLLNISEIEKWCRDGRVVSRFSTIEPKQTIDAVTGAIKKTGFTFGKRGSRTFLRIYDKAVQEQKLEHHIRVELETRNQKAHQLACKLAGSGESMIAGVISGVISFKVKGNGTRRERWKTQPKWKRFLGEAAKIRLTTAPSERSLEKLQQSLEKQYAPALAMLVDAKGPQVLEDLVAVGRSRLSSRHQRIMREYERQNPS